MGLIPEDKIAEIRDRTDIAAVIGERVPLRRAGGNYVGLCPFHPEKSPSFNVNVQKGFFYCFGCQKTGDVFRFLMELDGRGFSEVARELARRAGVEIPEGFKDTPEQKKQRQQHEDERQRLIRVCDIASSYFEAQLARSERAQAYLNERGVSKEVARSFRLGYAPEGWDGLLAHLANRKVPHELAEKAGLLVRREEAERLVRGVPADKATHYDRFRDRVIFPLLSPSSEVIAFGGRVLPSPQKDSKEGAKYINSPESPIYKKGDNLYGLHAARESIRKGRQVILVEGNFDVISLHQHGFLQTVAPMGTALTETQVRILKRLLDKEGHVVLMLDGDRAGRSATMKDIWLFSQANIEDLSAFAGAEVDIRVAHLPDGEDPDTYVAKDRAGFERRLKSAKPAVDYVLDEAIKLAEHDNVAGKAKVLMQVAPLLRAISNPTTLDMYIDRLADSLAISPGVVRRHIRAEVTKQAQGTQRTEPNRGPAQVKSTYKADPIEMSLIAVLGDHPQLAAQLTDEVLDRLTDLALADLLREARDLAKSQGQGQSLTVHQLIELAPPEMKGQVASAALGGTFSRVEHPSLALETVAKRIRVRALERELKELQMALLSAVKAGDEKRRDELAYRIREIQQRQEIRLMKGDLPQA